MNMNKWLLWAFAATVTTVITLSLSGCGPMMMANMATSSENGGMKCGGMMGGMKCGGMMGSMKCSGKQSSMKCGSGTEKGKTLSHDRNRTK